MEPFEYVVVLSSLILGLGIAQLLTGIADIVSNLKNVKLSLAHSLMVFIVFLLHIQEWWYSYQYLYLVQAWTLPLVLFLLIYPILLFLLARMLFPTGLRGNESNLNEYYYDQWKWLYSIVLGIVVVSFFQNVMVSGEPVSSQILHFLLGPAYLVFIIFNVNNKLAHTLFMGVQAIGWILIILFDPYTIG